MINYSTDLKIFFSDKINDENFFGGFSTRALGDGRKTGSIFDFFAANRINYNQIVIPGQIHSTNIQVFDTSDEASEVVDIEDTDGIVTKNNGVLLTVVTADCAPIIFADKKNGVIGISHQGWRGSLKRLVQKMIKTMINQGAILNKISVAIGPAIGACCYTIDEDRYYNFLEEFDGYSSKIFSLRHGQRHLNLMLLNYLLIKETGVDPKNIDFFPFCTKCDHNRFFSFRGQKREDFGEMFSFIMKI